MCFLKKGEVSPRIESGAMGASSCVISRCFVSALYDIFFACFQIVLSQSLRLIRDGVSLNPRQKGCLPSEFADFGWDVKFFLFFCFTQGLSLRFTRKYKSAPRDKVLIFAQHLTAMSLDHSLCIKMLNIQSMNLYVQPMAHTHSRTSPNGSFL